MKKQETFTDIEYSFRKKKAKREEFLEIMDEIIPWDEFFRFEKEGHTCFRDIRGKLIDLCPEYQSDRESLLKIWEREMNGIWY